MSYSHRLFALSCAILLLLSARIANSQTSPVLLNRIGDGRPVETRVADVNGDGNADILVLHIPFVDGSNHTVGSTAFSLLLGNGAGTFQTFVDTPVTVVNPTTFAIG